MSKKGAISTDEIHEFFEENQDLRLTDLDETLLAKLIIHALDQCIMDDKGHRPDFSMTTGCIFMEVGDKRFSLSIRDNNKYS